VNLPTGIFHIEAVSMVSGTHRVISSRRDWAAAAKIAAARVSKKQLLRVVSLLPSHRTPPRDLVKELRRLGRHYHWRLHEIEFGPTRAERRKLYRSVRRDLDRLRSLLSLLPKPLRLSIGVALATPGLGSARSDADAAASHSLAAETGVAALAEAAAIVGKDLKATRKRDSTPLSPLREAARRAAATLARVDPSTREILVFVARFAPLQPAEVNGAQALTTIAKRVDYLRRRAADLLPARTGRRGPQPGSSEPWLAGSLCELWERETGRPATGSVGPERADMGVPQSAASKFVLAAARALLPTGEWQTTHARWEGPSHTHLWHPGVLERAIHLAMRRYLALRPVIPGQRGRPRKR
jgi:hypothetical protein